MAQQIQTILIDDIDGGDAVETVNFALDGRSYVIDLNEANAAELRKAMEKFVAAARRASSGSYQPRRQRGKASIERPGIRDWARENGFTISARGRIPADVAEAYDAAH